jgi:hypothetical protein
MSYRDHFEDTKTMWAFNVIFATFFLVIAFMFYYVCRMEQESTKRHLDNEQKCKDLNAMYGDLLKVKEGPYSKTTLKAVEFGSETIGVLIEDQTKISTFLCGDLKKVEEEATISFAVTVYNNPKYQPGDCLQLNSSIPIKIKEIIDEDYGVYVDASCDDEPYNSCNTSVYNMQTVDKYGTPVECP